MYAGLDGGHLDVTDAEAVQRCVTALQPAAIMHLAAKTYLPAVLSQPRAAYAVNVGGTLNVLDAAAASPRSSRILLVSSCAVYGDPVAEHLPLSESAPTDLTHPYGLQKLAAERLAQSAAQRGLSVVIARPFNHIGAGMNRQLSLAHFAAQIAAAEQGRAAPILRVGNLEAQRDFLHASDVVSAYVSLLATESASGVFNVASGAARSMRSLLDHLLSLSTLRFHVETDAARLRAQDPALIVGNAGRLRRETGWEPRHQVADALAEILAEARSA